MNDSAVEVLTLPCFFCREASLSSCRSCPSSSWLLCQPSARSWSTAPLTASASGRECRLLWTPAKEFMTEFKMSMIYRWTSPKIGFIIFAAWDRFIVLTFRCLRWFRKDILILPQLLPNIHRPLLCLRGLPAPCVWPASMFVFQIHFCSFWPVCEPLSAMSHISGDRRCQICHARAAFGHVISLPHFVLSWRRSAGYTQKRLTENLKVPYYVGEQFSKEFTGVNLKNLERTVEDDYVSNLRNNCWKEKQQSAFARTTNRACLFIYLTKSNGCSAIISPGKMIKDIFWFLLPLIYLSWIVSLVSCRGRHALQSSLFWRHWSVPKSTEGSHTKLRQAVRDHSFITWLTLLSSLKASPPD